MRRIKVMHVWKDCDTYYGVHDQLGSLARHIDKDQFELGLCLYNDRADSFSSEFENRGITTYSLGENLKQSPLIPLKLMQFLKTVRPDVVQTYCLNTNVYGGIAARLAGVPVVISTELTQKDQTPGRIKQLRDRFLYPVSTLVRYFSDTTVFVSQGVKRVWVGTDTSERYRVIYSPFSDEKYEEFREKGRGCRKRNGSYVIGVVARLSEEKGHRDLLAAMREVVKRFPRTKLEIIGTGPYEGDLKRYSRKLNLSESVVFKGHKRNVFEALNEMDLFVLPSRSEGLGIAIIEAMVMGLPIIATCVGGIPEVVVNDVTGILVPPRNPALLADAIIKVFSNWDEAKQMGERGKERALGMFHAREFTRKHEELYRELLSKKVAGKNSGRGQPFWLSEKQQ